MSVFPSLMGQIEKTGVFSVTLEDVDGTTSALPSFSSLPRPAQVWKLVQRGDRIGAAKRGEITLAPKAFSSLSDPLSGTSKPVQQKP